MLSGLTGAGAKTSEFLAMVGNVVAQIALAWTGELDGQQATRYGVYGAIAYILSRGFAKVEARSSTSPPSPPAA